MYLTQLEKLLLDNMICQTKIIQVYMQNTNRNEQSWINAVTELVTGGIIAEANDIALNINREISLRKNRQIPDMVDTFYGIKKGVTLSTWN